MSMPGRKYQAGTASYRYSINGQEKEGELNENITTAEYWVYDSRIGRRWNIDPIIKESESPYSVFSNNPIWNIDPHGADTLKFLSNDQALDAMKIASNTLKNTLDKKQKISTNTTSSTPARLTSQVSGDLMDAASDYAQKNKLSYAADAEFNSLVQDYADGLRQAYLYGGEQSFNGINKYLNSQGNSKTSSTYALRRVITRVLEIQLRYQGVVEAGLQAAMLVAGAGVFPEVGSGPKGTYKSNLQQKIVISGPITELENKGLNDFFAKNTTKIKVTIDKKLYVTTQKNAEFINPPSYITRETLLKYRNIAMKAINGPKGDGVGAQKVRVDLIDQALKTMK